MSVVRTFSQLGLSAKILLMGVVLSIAFPIPLLVWLLPAQRSNIYNIQAEATQHVVEVAWGVLNYYGQQAAKGAMSNALHVAQTWSQ